MKLPFAPIEFTKAGAVADPAQVEAALKMITDNKATDVLFLVHGWNNDMGAARRLYDRLVDNLADEVRGSGARPVVIGVMWPSVRWADEELLAGGGASVADEQAALAAAIDDSVDDPAVAARLGALIGRLDTEAGRAAFLDELRTLLPSDEGSDDEDDPDAVPSALRAGDSEEVFDAIGMAAADADDLAVAPATSSGAPGVAPDLLADDTEAAGLFGMDWLELTRLVLNTTTYYTMKARAGDVGANGVAPLVDRLNAAVPDLRIHLAGHSFGARVVAAAASNVKTPIDSLTLLQGAFSHYGFTRNFANKGRDGAFVGALANKRIQGPVVITHTHNDKAVRLAYAVASRLARQAGSAVGDREDLYGGIGANGAVGTDATALQLGDASVGYQFKPGAVHNLLADKTIANHGDVSNSAVANALAHAMGLGSGGAPRGAVDATAGATSAELAASDVNAGAAAPRAIRDENRASARLRSQVPEEGGFDEAYARGVTEEVGPPASRDRAMPPEPFALHGAVITPDAAWSSGYVTIAAGRIDRVSRRKPTDVRVLETDGVILPGMLDLHGHPEFNVFAAWEPPRLYANRYRWRGSDVYQALVRDPQNRLIEHVPAGTQTRYAEVRALVGGVTGIQGASRASTAAAEPLVRNLDLWAFDAHKARSMIDLPADSSRDMPRLVKVLEAISAGEVTAFYLHLSEGKRGDERSAAEFARFLEVGAATPATNIIHGTALTADDWRTVADAGCRLVWSPQSNLRLYGETTLAGAALDAGVLVALGADWLPSGSTSLLAELKVARRELARQGHPLGADALVRMVTSVAAQVAGLSEHLGALAPGRPADVLVLERQHEDPYESVCLADPSWVELVCIGGDITYGRTDWFETLSGSATGPTIEDVIAWGKPMRLDTGFQAPADAPAGPLSEIRSLLTEAYPPVGPIFA